MTDSTIPPDAWIAAHYSLTLTVAGTALNILTFVVLCRATFRDTKTKPILHYMRTIAIFDILMLYGWNLDHYCTTIHGFAVQLLTLSSCKFFSFLNYFTPQVSAWLRVFVSLDRYLSLSRLHKTWFGHSKNILIIIAAILVCFFLVNGQFFIVGCSIASDGKISMDSLAFTTYPTWDYINLALYNCAPFVLMVAFNTGVIYHLTRLRQTSTVQNSRIQHRSISITLVITTFMFLFMTIPVTVGYAFFSSADQTVLHFLDGILYTYHVLSFPLYMITYDEFRHEFINMILCRKGNRRIGPVTNTGTGQQPAATTKTKITA